MPWPDTVKKHMLSSSECKENQDLSRASASHGADAPRALGPHHFHCPGSTGTTCLTTCHWAYARMLPGACALHILGSIVSLPLLARLLAHLLAARMCSHVLSLTHSRCCTGIHMPTTSCLRPLIY